MQRHDRESRRKRDEKMAGDERMARERVQACRYRPRAVRHVGATKVFYACQMRVLVSDLTLNSLDDSRDRLAFESNSSQDSRLRIKKIVQVLHFRVQYDDLIIFYSKFDWICTAHTGAY